MNQKKKKYTSKLGLPPGSLIHVGEVKTDKVVISRMVFNNDHFQEETIDNIKKINIPESEEKTTWYAINGLHDTSIIEFIGKTFHLDNLVLEDILNTNTRPTAENFDEYIFITFKILGIEEKEKNVISEQISLVLGKNWLLTFHEGSEDIFDAFRDRIRQAKGIIRQRNEDYFFYRLIDISVDNYYLITEFIIDIIDDLEARILKNTEDITSEEIYKLKRLIGQQKKSIIPVREAISSIIRMDTKLISKETQKFLRDVYEHTVQIIDSIERQRETVNDLLNLFMSGLSNKMNEVMKVLTIFASIFIPLTFIAGIYGMNFEVMPELHWKYGYFVVWGILVAVAIALLIYFKRKKWL